MISDEWALTSIDVLDSQGQATKAVDLAGLTLDEQLGAAEAWLVEHGPELCSGSGTERRVRLFVSWTPAVGRHAMTLPATLITALANVGGVFWLDVYPEGN